jgi:hypothetical protein
VPDRREVEEYAGVAAEGEGEVVVAVEEVEVEGTMNEEAVTGRRKNIMDASEVACHQIVMKTAGGVSTIHPRIPCFLTIYQNGHLRHEEGVMGI